MVVAHCPHCLLGLTDADGLPYPPRPQRCPHCRLVIGVGRARADDESAEGGARAHGTAAGVLANAVKRTGGEQLDHAHVCGALRLVASTRGCPLDRLRMLDYQQQAETDPALPSLAGVIATFGTWKSARSAAVSS